MKRQSLGILCLASVLVVACANPQGRWENSTLPEETWKTDEADCRRRAMEIVERDFRQLERSRVDIPGAPSTQTLDIDRYVAKRRQTTLVNTCMTGLGYKRATIKE